MTIETKYNIGDEVWLNTSQGIINGTIEEITITRYGILCEVSSEQIVDIQWPITRLFPTKEELLKSL